MPAPMQKLENEMRVRAMILVVGAALLLLMGVNTVQNQIAVQTAEDAHDEAERAKVVACSTQYRLVTVRMVHSKLSTECQELFAHIPKDRW